MIAWEWTIEKAREGEEEKTEKKKTRKISQSAQVKAGITMVIDWIGCGSKRGRDVGVWAGVEGAGSRMQETVV